MAHPQNIYQGGEVGTQVGTLAPALTLSSPSPYSCINPSRLEPFVRQGIAREEVWRRLARRGLGGNEDWGSDEKVGLGHHDVGERWQGGVTDIQTAW